MLRALYSGISGLKVHQTKMDVIGNNISNVNTVGFKSSNVNFSDILYQTTQSATGANAATGKAGTNAKQIGLGSTVAGISTNMTAQGGSQRTDNALDLMINGTAFFVVNSAGTNYFTKSGAFTIDGQGNLATESGALVMGWQVDPDNENGIIQDAVSALRIYSPENTSTAPEATTDVFFKGNIDQNDSDFESGKSTQMEFYDRLGNKYVAKYKITQQDTVDKNIYNLSLSDIVGNDGNSIFVDATTAGGLTTYTAKNPTPTVNFGGNEYTVSAVDKLTGDVTLSGTSATMTFNASTGKFVDITDGTEKGDTTTLSISTGQTGTISSENLFEDINVDFSSMTMFEDNGVSTFSAVRGDKAEGLGAGCTAGTIKGVSVGIDGRIYGSYDNGTTRLLGQIASATFTNPAGLEAVGNAMYQTTQNSGEFDGIGIDITAAGLSFSSGVLEMSNVDLATEFTNMITTQRGYQANSRIITTSDTLLEELINLKR